MPVFVAVVILGLAFFLFCLLAIHLDERRRRSARGTGSGTLIPLETMPRSARSGSYRRVIPLPANRATQAARPFPKAARRMTEPGTMRRRAVGGSPFTDLS